MTVLSSLVPSVAAYEVSPSRAASPSPHPGGETSAETEVATKTSQLGTPEAAKRACAYCGVFSGAWQASPTVQEDKGPALVPTCPLCLLCRRLDRPHIDEEAALMWLPEMSQGAINVIFREIHLRLRALGEDLCRPLFRLNTRDRGTLYHAVCAFSARCAAAAGRIDTDRPSELSAALLSLSPAGYAKREALLGGLRLMPLGTFFEGGRDVYPDIVDIWASLGKTRLGESSDAGGAPLDEPAARSAA